MEIILDALIKSFSLILKGDEGLFEIILLSLQVSAFSLLISCLIGLPMGLFWPSPNFPLRNFFLLVL